MAAKNQLDLASSFRPIVLCLQCVGINVRWDAQKPTNCRLIGRFYRLIWFLINVVAVLELMYGLYFVTLNDGSGCILNNLISFGTMLLQIAGTYGSLVMAIWKDGGQLAQSLRTIQDGMPINKAMLKKIRIASITSIVIVMILVRTIQAAYLGLTFPVKRQVKTFKFLYFCSYLLDNQCKFHFSLLSLRFLPRSLKRPMSVLVSNFISQ